MTSVRRKNFDTIQEIKEHMKKLDHDLNSSAQKYASRPNSHLPHTDVRFYLNSGGPDRSNSVSHLFDNTGWSKEFLGQSQPERPGSAILNNNELRNLLLQENESFISKRESEIMVARDVLQATLSKADAVQTEVLSHLNEKLSNLNREFEQREKDLRKEFDRRREELEKEYETKRATERNKAMQEINNRVRQLGTAMHLRNSNYAREEQQGEGNPKGNGSRLSFQSRFSSSNNENVGVRISDRLNGYKSQDNFRSVLLEQRPLNTESQSTTLGRGGIRNEFNKKYADASTKISELRSTLDQMKRNSFKVKGSHHKQTSALAAGVKMHDNQVDDDLRPVAIQRNLANEFHKIALTIKDEDEDEAENRPFQSRVPHAEAKENKRPKGERPKSKGKNPSFDLFTSSSEDEESFFVKYKEFKAKFDKRVDPKGKVSTKSGLATNLFPKR